VCFISGRYFAITFKFDSSGILGSERVGVPRYLMAYDKFWEMVSRVGDTEEIAI
jgi:hypothetical protein